MSVQLNREAIAAVARTEQEIEQLAAEINIHDERVKALEREIAEATDKKALTAIESQIADNRRERIVKANRLSAARQAWQEQNAIWAKKAIREIPNELLALRKDFLARLERYSRTKYSREPLETTQSLACQFDQITEICKRGADLIAVYHSASTILGEHPDPTVIGLPPPESLGTFPEFDRRHFSLGAGYIGPRFYGFDPIYCRGIWNDRELERHQSELGRIQRDVLHVVDKPDPMADFEAELARKRRDEDGKSIAERAAQGRLTGEDWIKSMRTPGSRRGTLAGALSTPD
jgi:hypothetical protein